MLLIDVIAIGFVFWLFLFTCYLIGFIFIHRDGGGEIGASVGFFIGIVLMSILALFIE